MARKGKKDVDEADEQHKKGERLVLVSFLVGGLAVILAMVLISGFLSNDAIDAERRPFIIGGFVVLSAATTALYLLGRRLSPARA